MNKFHIAIISILLVVVGCTKKPQDIIIPSHGRLTDSEVYKISKNLEENDRILFNKWVERTRKGNTYDGEESPLNVRDAILNQQHFEALDSARIAKVKELERIKKAEEDKKKKEEEHKRRQGELAYMHRKTVHDAISEYIEADITTYNPKTIYNPNGVPIGGIIEFILKIRNKADVPAIGIAGYVAIEDVFGNDLGLYPFAIEPRIGPGKTINYSVVLDFDSRDPKHHLLWRSKSIKSMWLFESAAFANGIRLDEKSIPALQQNEKKSDDA